jgi:hypothetical protein
MAVASLSESGSIANSCYLSYGAGTTVEEDASSTTRRFWPVNTDFTDGHETFSSAGGEIMTASTDGTHLGFIRPGVYIMSYSADVITTGTTATTCLVEVDTSDTEFRAVGASTDAGIGGYPDLYHTGTGMVYVSASEVVGGANEKKFRLDVTNFSGGAGVDITISETRVRVARVGDNTPNLDDI